MERVSQVLLYSSSKILLSYALPVFLFFGISTDDILIKYGIDLANPNGESIQAIPILIPGGKQSFESAPSPLRKRDVVLTLFTQDLVAHGKTRQEIAQHIHADEVIFQDLDDLKASCIEAAEGRTEIEDFEVGVFCGKYVTDVPDGYFEHLSRLRGRERKTVARAIEAAEPGQVHATVVTNSGPVNVASRGDVPRRRR